MMKQSFKKSCLISFLLLNVAFIQGCTAPHMSNQAQHKTMHEELLDFAQENHPKEDLADEQVTKIVEHFIHIGMSIEEAKQVCEKNDMHLSKAFNTNFQIRKHVDVYTGMIDNIFIPLKLMFYKRVGFQVEVKHGEITGITGYYLLMSRLG
jgi:exopolysaccharide biosynthesis protein